MSAAPARQGYRPSGRWYLPGLIRAGVLLAIVSAGIAFAYYRMLAGDFYVSAVSVFFPLVAAAGCTRLAVKHGHLRNPVLAGTLGALCGLTGYLGYFHLDQCLRWGASWEAIDRLPGYIAFRLETDQWDMRRRGAVLRPVEPAPGIQPIGWFEKVDLWSWTGLLFGLEFLALVMVPLATGVASGAEPYSEKRRCWCRRDILVVEGPVGQALRKALADGTVVAWVEARPPRAVANDSPCKVSLWYTPAESGRDLEADVYVSVAGGKAWQLSPEEAAAFVTLLPGVQTLVGPRLGELAHQAKQAHDPFSAHVWSVPSPYAGQSQNTWNRWRGRCRAWTLLLIPPVLALAAVIGGTGLLHEWGMRQKLVPEWLVIGYLIGSGLGALVFVHWWLYRARLLLTVLGRQFDYRLLCRALANRPHSLVSADDPRAVFAEMQPRRFWFGGPVPNGEYNQGLLLVNDDRQAILFEGDYQQYWIPRDAILTSGVETLPYAAISGLYAVVLHVRLGEGVWELPFFPLANIAGANSLECAGALLARIQGMAVRTFAENQSGTRLESCATPSFHS